MRLACRLRELREGRGLSIKDVEELTGVPRGHLSRIEHGTLLPKDEWIAMLEHVYGAKETTWYVPPPGAVVGVAILRDASGG